MNSKDVNKILDFKLVNYSRSPGIIIKKEYEENIYKMYKEIIFCNYYLPASTVYIIYILGICINNINIF